MKETEIISTDKYYDIYSNDLKIQIKSVEDEVAKYDATKEYLTKQLSAFKDILSTNKIDIITVENASEALIIKSFDKIVFDLTEQSSVYLMHNLSYDGLVRITRSIIAVNKLKRRNNRRLLVLKEELVSKELYKEVLKGLNIRISKSIIDIGYSFNFGSNIGLVKIIKKVRDHSKKSINWGASNKIRKEIEARGGTAYKAIKDESNRVIGDNGGEAWFVYFTNDVDYWWCWERNGNTPNLVYYWFRPSKENIALLNVAKQNPDTVLNYAELDSIVRKRNKRQQLITNT